ncbi:hypothetical protein N8J30_004112 [Salmonella enterica subsp. enterica serovar Newport]|nr:hypothetical protein [Salmonella enterica subsp. enterica serovar Newport]EJW0496985.1 hypothetical protein [Salmonella enterica subsp. enterica serovar Newport]ELA5318480.1 hypothetical protein [Salmonella enterica subsp. enterica serovar Newport]
MSDQMKSLLKQIDDIRLEINIQKNTYDLALGFMVIALNEISPKQNAREILLRLLHESASSAMAIADLPPDSKATQAVEEIIGRVDAIFQNRQHDS